MTPKCSAKKFAIDSIMYSGRCELCSPSTIVIFLDPAYCLCKVSMC